MREGLILDHYPMQGLSLPHGWESSSIESVAISITSGFPTGAHNSAGRGIPHIRPMNIDREGRFDLTEVKFVDGETPKLLQSGDVLFNNTNSPELIGKTTVISSDDPLAFSHHMTRVRLEDGMNPAFVARQLHYLWMSGYFRHRCKNHVNQASIAAEPLAHSVPLLVPPSKEQERIADVLDELLSDLDAGEATIERVLTKLKHYRAAVLKAAVEGTLTTEWRRQHPATETADSLLTRILEKRRRSWEEAQLAKFEAAGKVPPRGWKAKYVEPALPDTSGLPVLGEGARWVSLDQIAAIAGGVTKGQKVPDHVATRDVAYLRVANVQRGYLDLAEIKKIRATAQDIEALRLLPGDILFNEGGDRDKLGRGWIWEGQIEECIHQNHVFRARLLGRDVQPKIVSWAGNSYGQKWFMRTGKQSVNLASINLTVLRSFPVPLFPAGEQDAIVETIEDQLSVIDHLELDLERRLTGAHALRQSILRKAFTGQLVPQDPSDETASKQLARIATERTERTRLALATKQANPRTRTARAKKK